MNITILSIHLTSQVLEISLYVKTLPKTLTIKTQENLLQYSATCHPSDDVSCIEWTEVTIYG